MLPRMTPCRAPRADFFFSLNGNLVKASAVIAVKLSKSQAFFRAAFFIVFYHRHILELRGFFHLHHLLLQVPTPMPYWELRSMAMAILDSRWCTQSWVENLVVGLRPLVFRKFQHYCDALAGTENNMTIQPDLLPAEAGVHGTLFFGEPRHGQCLNLSIGAFESSIMVTFRPMPHRDETDALWRLNMTAFRTIPCPGGQYPDRPPQTRLLGGLFTKASVSRATWKSHSALGIVWTKICWIF
jgi:hypothetical protein